MPTISLVGKCYTFPARKGNPERLKFYAQNGCICMHDEEEPDQELAFRVIACAEWKARTKALNEEAKKLRLMAARDSKPWYDEERKRIVLAVERMIACYWEAKNQGDPTDPEVMDWYLRHQPRRRARVSYQMPAASQPTGKFSVKGQSWGIDIKGDDSASVSISPPKPKLILPT